MPSKTVTVSMAVLMTMGALMLAAAPAGALTCNHLPDADETAECAKRQIENTWIQCTDGRYATVGYALEHPDCLLP